MRSLANRPRTRRLLEEMTRAGLRALDTGEPAPPPLSRESTIEPQAAHAKPVTRRLFELLEPEDVSRVEAAIAADAHLALQYGSARDEDERQQLILTFGVWVGDHGVLEHSGLSAAQPPEDVHAMARGPLAAAGGLYEADLVVAALASAGVEIARVARALDFGCSSGRVLRVLQAAYPETAWSGCDPNRPAIEWAAAHLPGVDFFASGNEPPLPLEDSSLDLAYAISIWSHFAPALGARWLEEMHRLLRPGGHLVCTTHGLTSIAHYVAHGLRTPQQSQEIADALYRRGWWYAPEFGRKGDWGVVNPDWGTAFLSPEWMLTQLCPRWRVLGFGPGSNQENQDVYVLERA